MDLDAVHREVEEGATLLGAVLHLGGRGYVAHDGAGCPVEAQGEERAALAAEGVPPATALVGYHRHLRAVHPAGVGHAGAVIEALLGAVLAAYGELAVVDGVTARALVQDLPVAPVHDQRGKPREAVAPLDDGRIGDGSVGAHLQVAQIEGEVHQEVVTRSLDELFLHAQRVAPLRADARRRQ